eukprot:1982019-Amphidinium_carterae.1
MMFMMFMVFGGTRAHVQVSFNQNYSATSSRAMRPRIVRGALWPTLCRCMGVCLRRKPPTHVTRKPPTHALGDFRLRVELTEAKNVKLEDDQPHADVIPLHHVCMQLDCGFKSY